MSSHVRAQNELDHIKTMICYLERERPETFAPTSAVADLDYWRTRIRAVLTLPNTPRQITDQASVLLARLDRAAVARRGCVEARHAKAAA
jgi:hypothetical protein